MLAQRKKLFEQWCVFQGYETLDVFFWIIACSFLD
jgi:hypothetical protein